MIDDNKKTKRYEQYRSPYELRPGDKRSTQLNIANNDGDLVIISTSPPVDGHSTTNSESTSTITINHNNDDDDASKSTIKINNNNDDDGRYINILAGDPMRPVGSGSCTKSRAVPPTGVGLTGWGAEGRSHLGTLCPLGCSIAERRGQEERTIFTFVPTRFDGLPGSANSCMCYCCCCGR